MSRPIGSACCDWTVELDDRTDHNGNEIYTCDHCGEVCEVIL